MGSERGGEQNGSRSGARDSGEVLEKRETSLGSEIGEGVAEEGMSATTLNDSGVSAGVRHGALLQPEVEDWMLLESPYMTYWSNKRHRTNGDPRTRRAEDLPDWRMRERLRTVTAALVMCLNIGVDPPDVSKTNPCAHLICWMDPESLDASKALPAIGRNLQVQFETLSMKTRYKQYLDPIVEEIKRFCTNLRRTAKEERVLFYYNGYGVPKPTPGGEIWVFNKAYTQYIPLTLYDLQTWLGSPCIYVWDTSAAGNIVNNFHALAEARAEEEAKAALSEGREPPPLPNADGITIDANGEPQFPLRDSIHLAACGADEILPMNPDLPADLFTSCLTSPIEISLRWFVLQNPLPSSLNIDMVMNIPGRLQDRRTPLGELNWILTAVTDTIAWTVLPRGLFRRFFRDDLMVAALLRNFLLAQRIMRFYHCTPVSHPRLPPTHDHPLWDSWDLALDQCLAQLPTLLAKEEARTAAANGGDPVPPHLAAFEYQHSSFFSEQLKAFEVWLSQGDVSRRAPRRRVQRHPVVLSTRIGAQTEPRDQTDWNSWQASAYDDQDDLHDAEQPVPQHDPPSQLPIVLQVLLSQVHRLRALILLSQFLDLAPWAVNLALSIGIFPYVLKLLQSPAADLRPVLIYIWARILAVDHSCQVDLLRDNGYQYFTTVLSPFQTGANANWSNNGNSASSAPNGNPMNPTTNSTLPIPNVSEHRAMCAFILAVFCQDFVLGQDACLETDVMDSCLEHLEDDDFLLRQWSALCLAQLWNQSESGKAKAIAKDAHGKLCCLLSDASPEVRAGMLYALGVLLGTSASAYDPLDPSSAGVRRDARSHASSRRPCIGLGSLTTLDAGRMRSVEVGIGVALLSSTNDCSPLVRKELVITLSALVALYDGFFVLVAYMYYARDHDRANAADLSLTRLSADVNLRMEEEEQLLASILRKILALGEDVTSEDIANIPALTSIFVTLLDLCVDPHMEVASMAATVVDAILASLLESGLLESPNTAFQRFNSDDLQNPNVVPTKLAERPSQDNFAPLARSQTMIDVNPSNTGSSRTVSNTDSKSNTGSFHPHMDPSSSPSRRASSTALERTVTALKSLGGYAPTTNLPPKQNDHGQEMQRVTVAGPKVRVNGHWSTFAEYQSPYASPHNARMPGSRPRSHQSTPGVEDVLSNMLANNLRTLRTRKPSDEETRAKSPTHHNLPLQSRFFAWCSEYFTEPQMKSAEAEEPGSVQYNQQTWRRQRSEDHVAHAIRQSEGAALTRWTHPMGRLPMAASPTILAFQELEPLLVTASDHAIVNVYDWEERRHLSSFRNGNLPQTDITSLAFINEEVNALLLTGSADGDVRIYDAYDHPAHSSRTHGPHLVSSFRALPDLIRSEYPSGLRVAWQQVTGRLLAAGDSRLIRTWDAHRELCIADIPTHASSCVSSLTSDGGLGHLFVAGFGDGSIGVYDQRNPPASALVRLWEEHRAWVQNVHLQRHGSRELLSASVDGDVRIWDLRADRALDSKNLSVNLRESLSSFAVHQRVPVYAAIGAPYYAGQSCGQSMQMGTIDPLQTLGRPFQRALQTPAMASYPQRYSPPSAYSPSTSLVTFHPQYPIVAYGGMDHTLELRRYVGA
ncbi:Target of rapamycin complex 1 subunit kog1 [Malassezia yamatoensis]|uniref:Target of rapamycin complex 1 subunit kog1 n=1 Tax=Malassezia yamatoensis TaxID=253288 RepID=A0AAJ6CIJ5_9BASI|nr:Target of rapamycin complex 1 subunit kog1 [Malassezia yamatoensis]